MAVYYVKRWSIVILFIVMVASPPLIMAECSSYSSIFSFGDSKADTGNLFFGNQYPSHHCLSPPNGQTYFHHTSGRCSDGRLIIDFIAESLGIPMVKPYLGIKKGVLEDSAVKDGVNFAVIAATALDISFFEERDIHYFVTNYSLNVQMNWFKELLSAVCNNSKSCHEVLGNSLFLVGEIGGNDFIYLLYSPKSIEEIKTYVPYVINAITSVINELIDLGAQTLMVPGSFPMGCNACFLTKYETKDKNQYDSFGCLKKLNEFAAFYNQNLQNEIQRLRGVYPHANIIYVDYYNALLPLYQYPSKFGISTFSIPDMSYSLCSWYMLLKHINAGFLGLKACCGMGGSYNFNESEICGKSGVVACDDPSQYISWDGIHLTEVAHRLIAHGIINGPYSLPKFRNSCSINLAMDI